ncbi:MAG: molybdopterin molybdotransferase MoeA [Paludibacter sp.]|nr:molybdopterin molybdotransferase MoeA [Paludibacter sp.]
MITIDQSNLTVAQIKPLEATEEIGLNNSLGRILAKPIVADIDQPSFDKSAMDGYACKREDLQKPLKVVGVIAAGTMVDEEIQAGECYRIFTGAPLPPGADCVIMQEDTIITSDGLVHFKAEKTKDNICYCGEDGKAGKVVVELGTRIRPQHLAIMAGYGVVNPTVTKKPTVSFFCSGSELIEPSEKPQGAMIRNSNASQLIGQLTEAGAEVSYKGIISDDFELVSQSLKANIGKADVIIITGGASVGDFDFIPAVLKNIGAEIKISALNMQPGKPVLFAVLENTLIFGLSGNPVSSFLQFKVLVEPVILKLSGANSYLPSLVQILLATDIVRKKGNRQLYVPVSIDAQGQAEHVDFNGSAHINALNLAQGFVIVKPDINQLKAGELVFMILI